MEGAFFVTYRSKMVNWRFSEQAVGINSVKTRFRSKMRFS